MFSTLFLILFSASVAGIAYLVLKKAPILSRISQESLVDQETFAAWMARSARRIFFLLHPGRIRMHLFAQAAHILNAVRVLFFKMYHTIETMAKTAKEKSQKMDWEHHWFSEQERAAHKKTEEESDTHGSKPE